MSATSPPPRTRFSPTPIEETVKKVRKFAIEPVETTTRSNKKENVGEVEQVEETTAKKDFAVAAPPKRRFLPQPVETTQKSSKDKPLNPLPTQMVASESKPQAPAPADPPAPRRRFAPQLIEESKRFKRSSTPGPATLPTDKTDITPGTNHIYVDRKKKYIRPIPVAPTPGNTPTTSSTNVHSQISPLPPHRQPSMRPHLNSRTSTRQNSYQPELDPIESSESEENSDDNHDDEHEDGESTPSLSGSLGSSEDSILRMQMARTRESCDERFSGYLLALAAKAAEKQLMEQALAAFPNESAYEIVEHFYDREIDTASEEESVEGVGMLVEDVHMQQLRSDSTEVGWAAKEMQQHQENLNRLREEETNKRVAEEATAPTFHDPFWTNGMTDKIRPSGTPQDKQKEAELVRMRNAASPPMLGGDLKFRMCPSPKATKFESDQRHDVQPHRVEDGGGLWGGYCVAEENEQYLSPDVAKRPQMIATPHAEMDDPFSSAFSSAVPDAPPRSSERSKGGIQMLSGLDTRLRAEVARSKAEDMLLDEFDDTFVTQVYNYLSLGYPSLARQYDEELSRISQIPEEELRIDDKKQNVKGHIGLVAVDGHVEEKNGKKITGERSEGGYGARWKALRLYILEWARQHPSMSNGASSPSAWGVRARRGSWAI
ncbi:hypothetical protein MFRU_020g01070 [Monilinia fructicola]|uniref:Uncharacterized protein n=2 Tax=Monilinia fructicola TaxID=38448 RepID=A0A5M9K4K4_MONFR|nr:hypothetical protein EYC84_004852 [Monilinia fructicola]KAG4028668.1 hypothetical protein MFRU_020g01070 [Monilinia fructicola]